jgi:hypothetical protein
MAARDASSDEIAHPLRDDDAKRLLRVILNDHDVTWLPHAVKAMSDDGLSVVDCTNVLRGGWVEFSEPVGAVWRYRFRTRKVVVVVEFESRTHLVVVTTWREGVAP